MEKVVVTSASADKLYKFKTHAATYAALIMEVLDPDHIGYIEVKMYKQVLSSSFSPLLHFLIVMVYFNSWQLETLLKGMVSLED